jgi:hypothetical protein
MQCSVSSRPTTISYIGINQRTGEEIEVSVTWSAGAAFTLPLSRGSWSAADIIYRLFGEMQDYLADHKVAWGEARPPCPGHSHPRNLVLEGTRLHWNCPTDGVGPPTFAEVLEVEQT